MLVYTPKFKHAPYSHTIAKQTFILNKKVIKHSTTSLKNNAPTEKKHQIHTPNIYHSIQIRSDTKLWVLLPWPQVSMATPLVVRVVPPVCLLPPPAPSHSLPVSLRQPCKPPLLYHGRCLVAHHSRSGTASSLHCGHHANSIALFIQGLRNVAFESRQGVWEVSSG